MHSTRPLWQPEERVRNHLKLVPNTILAIMRPGCLILTATILRSSIKASRRQNIVHQGGANSCGLDTSRSRSSFTPYTEHLNEYPISSRRASFACRIPLGPMVTVADPRPYYNSINARLSAGEYRRHTQRTRGVHDHRRRSARQSFSGGF